MIPIYNNDIDKYKEYSFDAINSGWISNYGEYIQKSENKLKEILNVNHAILMSNGTCATHCIYLALKYKYPNITTIYLPNYVYVAVYNCCLMVYDKINIKILKTDENTLNFNTDTDYLNTLEKDSAIVIVHNTGNVINILELKKIRPDIIFIEDNCEGFTGKYENYYTGTQSLCSSLSFYGNKIITTGEGGAFLTNDIDIYNYIKKIYSQSMTNERYVHDNLAYNYRMSNIQASLLYGQLLDFDNIIFKKKIIFDNYNILFTKLIDKGKVTIPIKNPSCLNANWIFTIKLNNIKYKDICKTLIDKNIDTRPFFCSLNNHKHLKDIQNSDNELLYNNIFMIPSGITITYEEQKYIVNIIEKILI